ncbi:MAG: tetratricopeptide repeat protein [Planctomycetota bacterium]
MKMLNCNKKWLSILVVILVTVLFHHLLAQESADSVSFTEDQGKSVKEESGEITNETFEGIELKIKVGVIKKIKLNQIRSVTYRDEPTQYMQAKEFQESGKYTQAIELYNKIIADGRSRAIFKQHILYNIAASYQLAGQVDDALKAYDGLLKEFPQSRYFRDAYFNKSQCAVKKDLKMAIDILDDAKVKAKQLGFEDIILEVDFRKAMLMEDNNKFDDAKAIYNRLVSGAQREPTILYRAWVGVGRIEVINKNFNDAEKAFNEVIEKSEDFLANAGAYNGRADCTLARSSAPDSKIYKNALFDYLRSKVLYPVQTGEPTIEAEKATYYAGYCFEKLAQSLSAEKKKVYINNARALYQELKEKFSRSKFISKANERLSELGK